MEDREMTDPLAEAHDLIEEWLEFAENEHTFNYIRDEHWTKESDTNADVLSDQYEETVEKLMSKSDKFLKEVCKLCGGDNDHQSKCQMDDVEDIPF